MLAKQLKRSILHAAIQGKLTQQMPDDGDTQGLIVEIKKEKARLIEEGKPKKEEPLSEIAENELPFDIPENWRWIRLGEICGGITSGSTPPQECFSKKVGIPYLKVYNIVNNKINFQNKAQFINKEVHNTLNKRSILHPGDVIMNIVGPPLGKIAIVTDEYPEWNCNQAIVFFRPFVRELSEWIYTFLCEGSFLNSIELIGTAGQDNISVTKSKNIIIPMPPLKEQKRIIKRINSFFPAIDSLESDEYKLDDLQTAFPKKMRDSVLQYAVEGKLTEQLPSDGDAHDLLKEIYREKDRLVKEGKIRKEKPLPEITEEEKPFDIPENWCWARLGEVTNVIMGQSPDGSSVGNKGIEFHQGKIFFTEKIIGYSGKKCAHPKMKALSNSVLLCVRAPVGVVNITNREICIGRGLANVNGYGIIQNEYLFYYLHTMKKYYIERSTGSTFKAINKDTINESPFPLPPLAEQKRIVERLNKLLPICASIDIEVLEKSHCKNPT